MIFLLLILFATSAHTQETDSITVNATIPALYRLVLSKNNASFPTPSKQDFRDGYVDLSRGVNVRVYSNAPWRLSVQGEAQSTVTPAKSLSDFSWRIEGAQAFTTFLETDQTVTESNDRVNNFSVPLDFRAALDWGQDIPQDYTVTVTFTLGAIP